MSVENCVAEIIKAAGRELEPKELDQVSEKVARIVQKLDAQGQADNFDAALMQALKSEVDTDKVAAIVAKRNAVKNRVAYLREYATLKNVWGNDPGEGLQAMLGGSMTGRKGAKSSVAAAQDALNDRYVGAMGAALEKEGVFKLAISGELDPQIWKAMWHLNTPEPDQAALKALQPEAVTIARIYNTANEAARLDANHAGAWIKKMAGYVIKRTHDNNRIAKAAGDMVPANDPRHQQAWIDYVSDRIDWEATMPDVPLERRGAILQDLFTQFASGVHVRFSDAPTAGFQGFANVGKRMSQERVLHFKSPEAEFEYNTQFGSGTLAEGMFFGLQHMARDVELMRRLGPNAEATFDRVVSQTKQDLVKAGDAAAVAKFDQKAQYLKRVLWPALTGELNIAENNTFARYSSMVRGIETMADLGGAVLSAPSDLAFTASALRQQGVSMLDGMVDAVGYLTKGVGSAEQRHVLAETGVWLDSLRVPMFNRYSPDDGPPGTVGRMVQSFFKYNGLRAWTDRMRGGFTLATAHRLANHAEVQFDALPMRDLLQQYNITKAEWDLLRASPQRHADGRAFITPESAMEASDDAVTAYLKSAGRAVSPLQITRAREELAGKMRSFFQDQATTAVVQPDTMTRAMLLNGQRPGTVLGESLRHFWMYKGFTASVMRRVLGREVWGYGMDRLPLHQALFNMLKDPTGSPFVGMANVIAFSTMLGYGSMMLKDVAKGREPRLPDDPEEFRKLMAAAMAQGGGMGIYGDFLFGEAQSRYGQGALATFLGPTWRRLETIASWKQKLIEGDKLAAKALNDVLSSTPFMNLFYTRTALDYLILYRMQEWASPGYLRRLEQRMQEENDQSFVIPPTSVVPYGGF
jgi:hypothetical protein